MHSQRNNLTQSMAYQTGSLSCATSPQKNFKTRTVYKNAPVQEDSNDRRSLYGASYNQTPKANGKFQASSDSKSGVSQSQKLTLADLGAGKRFSGDKTNMNKTAGGKSIGFDLPKSRESNGSGAKSGQFSERNGRNDKYVKQPSENVELEVKLKGGEVLMSRHKVKANETVTDTIRHPQERAKSVATGKNFYDCGCPIHDGREVVASDDFKSTMRSDLGNKPYVMDGEAEYFDAVRKLDICGNCWKQQKQYYPDPKMIYKGPGQSLYKRDYVKHPLGDKGPVLKNDFYSTFQSNFPLDATTTMRNDYKPWKTGPVKKETMNFKPATSGIPFGGNTNYRIDYPNWGPNMIIPEKAPHQKTTISELPFNGNTTYKTEFATPDPTNQLKPVTRDHKKSPYTSGIPFLGHTTHNATYKPFKVSKVPGFEPVEEYEPTQALPDHLKSLYNRDFGAPKPWICPAVVFMQHHPHPKFGELTQKAL